MQKIENLDHQKGNSKKIMLDIYGCPYEGVQELTWLVLLMLMILC